jgi:hypothetical protein
MLGLLHQYLIFLQFYFSFLYVLGFYRSVRILIILLDLMLRLYLFLFCLYLSLMTLFMLLEWNFLLIALRVVL